MRLEFLTRSIAVVALLGATACQTANTATNPPAEPTLASGIEKTPAPEAVRLPTKKLAANDLEVIYFDYDRWELREDARLTLKNNAQKIQVLGGQEKLVVEGHCDERGSEEYNLALSDRRASAVARYLEDLGVPGAQMRTASFGEMRPAAPGHDESAWSVNRRTEIRFDSRAASR